MNKKILILLCLGLFIVSISAVSATEDSNQTVIGEPDDLFSSDDTEIVSVEGDEIADVDNGTFTDLQKKIDGAEDGSTIILKNNYVYDESFEMDHISIYKNIIIDGNGFTVDGNYATSIFFIYSSKVVLKNINFINAYGDGDGGAVGIEDSNVTIENCTFINNTETSFGGGAIAIYSSDVLIDNSLFLNNSAIHGSAIYFISYTGLQNEVIISNSIFNNNMAPENFWIGGSQESENGYVYLTSNDRLLDYQMDFLLDHQVDYYIDWYAPYPNATFINVSYNEFKNQSFIFKEEDLNENIDNETIRFELYKDDVLLINTTNITKNGFAKIDYGNLSVGYYYLKAYYKNRTVSDTILVKNDVDFTMSVDDIFLCDDIVVNFNISKDIENYTDATGRIVIWCNPYNPRYDDVPEHYSEFKFKDNNIIIPFSDKSYSFISPGSYLVFLDFYGDNYYYSKRINQTFNIYPPDYNMTGNKTILTVEDFEKTYNQDKRLYVNLTDINSNPLKNKEILIKINGVTYKRMTDENGLASIAINLPGSTYQAKISFNGDDQYLPSTTIVYFTVLSTVYCDSHMVKFCKDSQAFCAQFIDNEGNFLAGRQATFNINGVFYARDIDEYGYAKLNINLNQGNYTITAINPESGEMKSCLIEILPTITDNHDLVKYFRNDSQYIVKLQGVDISYQKVTFNINGVFYERYSNESGQVKLNLNLGPGNYIITAEYNGCRVSNNITVLPILNTSDLEMSYMDGSTFNALVLDGQGRPYAGQNVTFNINGIFYTRVSDDEGISRLNVNLMAGEYIITSSYNGLNAANKVTISS